MDISLRSLVLLLLEGISQCICAGILHTHMNYATMIGKGLKELSFNISYRQKISSTKKSPLDVCLTENIYVGWFENRRGELHKKPWHWSSWKMFPMSALPWQTHGRAMHDSYIRCLNCIIGVSLGSRLGNACSFTLLHSANRNWLLSHSGHLTSQKKNSGVHGHHACLHLPQRT